MTELPETKYCILELDDGWLTVWFNRPEKRNALSDGLLRDIKNTLKSVESDRSVRGILFRGKGGVFCAGADLEGIKKTGKNTGLEFQHAIPFRVHEEVASNPSGNSVTLLI